MTRGLWDYTRAEHIADDYDQYFAHNSLFDFDEALLHKHFIRPGLLADLGCGTGRLLIPFARKGFRGLAIDLSPRMLGIVRQKAEAEQLPIDPLLANVTQLGCLQDQIADYCICMFSTLGMIRGRENRQQLLQHALRILKPGGLLVLHVHNRWYSLFEPSGRAWWWKNLWEHYTTGGDIERGDKFFNYRSIPNMYLHVFTQRELLRALGEAGFHVKELTPLDTERRHALRLAVALWSLARQRLDLRMSAAAGNQECVVLSFAQSRTRATQREPVILGDFGELAAHYPREHQ